MNKDQSIQLALAGTITFPATFPRTIEIVLNPIGSDHGSYGHRQNVLLVAIERPSPRVTIRRSLFVNDVRAVFIPRDLHAVDYRNGDWLIGDDIRAGIQIFLNRGQELRGIVFVAEQIPSLLEVSAGMTAAESSQYYPPLPSDRSVNHYDPYREVRTGQQVRPSDCESLSYGHEQAHIRAQGHSNLDCEGWPLDCEGWPIQAGHPRSSAKPYQTFDTHYPAPCEGAK